MNINHVHMARNEYLTDCCNEGQNIDNSNLFSMVSFPRFEDRFADFVFLILMKYLIFFYILIVVPESITTPNNLLQRCNN